MVNLSTGRIVFEEGKSKGVQVPVTFFTSPDGSVALRIIFFGICRWLAAAYKGKGHQRRIRRVEEAPGLCGLLNERTKKMSRQ